MRVGILGAGQMGEALIRGLVHAKNSEISVKASARKEETKSELEKKYSISCELDNKKLVKASDVVILCVKPFQAPAVLKDIKPLLTDKKLLVSICASLKLSQIRKLVGSKCGVVRAMPNTPALIRSGITVLVGEDSTKSQKDLEAARRIFATVGDTVELEESQMDAATALSGCGPAYCYLIIEALSDAGVKVGLSRKTALRLAARTLLGASKMVLDSRRHPAELKDAVTTPAGVTVDGIMALEEANLRTAFIKAVVAATEKSRAVGEEFKI